MTTININNLSKEQLEDLEKQIAEAKKVLTSYGRDRVVNMWRRIGLPTYQVWYGDF